jgi:hypothetical protein
MAGSGGDAMLTCARWLAALAIGSIGVITAGARSGGSGFEPPVQAAPPMQNVRGGHAIVGEVTALDGRAGLVALRTDKGSLQLYFPPSSLEAIRIGDRLEIRLAFVWLRGALGAAPRDPREVGSSARGR